MRSGADTTRWPNRGIASSAVAIFSWSRRRGGACSSTVRLQKSERSAGSFSTAHMTASASLIRALTALVLPRNARVLELVEPGPRQQVERAVDVFDDVALHEPNEHGAVVLDERRHAEH